MAELTADFLLRRLAQNGVRRIYGYPGDGINAIVGALERHKDAIEFVQVRHEEQAAFMACAHAKWTGDVGVCLATSGPGAIHLLNGLYDAKLDHQPVLAIVGQQARMGLGSHYQQEVDLQTLFKDVAHEYVQTAMEATQIRHLVDLAHRTALAERTVTCLIIPNDVAEEPAKPDPPREHDAVVDAHVRVRHAADGRLVVSVLRVAAEGRAGARRADRHRRPHALDPLPDGGRARRRRAGDAEGAASAARAQGGPLL